MCCLVLINILVHSQSASSIPEKQTSLNEVLEHIDGWQTKGRDNLDGEIVGELELDDYANHYFTDGAAGVFLYVGYYYQGKKVGAAHDPLVCFPGQGWAVSNRSTGEMSLDSKNDEIISFSSMVVERGGVRQLLIYLVSGLRPNQPGHVFPEAEFVLE